MRGSQVRFLPGSPKIPNQYAAWGNISFGAAFLLERRRYRGATPGCSTWQITSCIV